MASESYKVTYFNGRGRAELIRLILTFKEIEFEDVRISLESWPKVKLTTPQGVLPLLDEKFGDKRTYFQSMAIARHLARKYDLYGKDEYEKYTCDLVLDTVADCLAVYSTFLFAKDEERKEKVKNFKENHVPILLDRIDKILKDQDFLVGNNVTVADLCLYCALTDIKGVEGCKEVVEAHKNIEQHFQRIEQKFTTYLANRQQTMF